MFKKWVLAVLFSITCAWSANATAMPLTEMSLEELMNVEVTSVSKTPQYLSKIPAAVYVISNEEIRRSGATSIPEALRSVPGVQVAHIDANKWAVSIRGFNDRFANKLLVLMDGRSVYTPLFSGVYWDMQDTLMEDIDRIEVIRGPGGTIWGANAVNGVINIITKSAKDTHGGYASGGYGSQENGFGEFRYGSKLEKFHYRVYGKYFDRGNSFEGSDDWQFGRGGFRTDWDLNEKNLLTMQGDIYNGDAGSAMMRYNTTAPPFFTTQDVTQQERGGNFLARFTHIFNKDSDLVVQAYYDRTDISVEVLDEVRDTYDVDARFRFPLHILVPQEIIVGAGYRYSTDDIAGSFEVTLDPPSRSDDILSWSIQDEMRLIENFMTLTVGSKFEVNNYTGFEYQPSARLAIYPDSRNTIWGSITRAVRTPARVDEDVRITSLIQPDPFTGTFPIVPVVSGNEDIESEELIAYEAGVKSQVTDKIHLDIAGFYNEYDDLRTAEIGDLALEGIVIPNPMPPPDSFFIPTKGNLPVTLENRMEGETYGGELAVNYFVTDDWRLRASYSYLHISLHPEPTSDQPDSAENESPSHQAAIHSSFDLPWNMQFDIELRHVSELSAFNVPAYTVVDMRVAWKPRKDLELSLVGLNLFDAKHFETGTADNLEFLGHPQRVEPSVYGKVTWTWE